MPIYCNKSEWIIPPLFWGKRICASSILAIYGVGRKRWSGIIKLQSYIVKQIGSMNSECITSSIKINLILWYIYQFLSILGSEKVIFNWSARLDLIRMLTCIKTPYISCFSGLRWHCGYWNCCRVNCCGWNSLSHFFKTGIL